MVRLAISSASKAYSVDLAKDLDFPFLTSIKEIKSVVSVVEVSAVSERLILNRCAPLAAKLLEPVALSKRDVSFSGVTIVSVTLNPMIPV